MRKIVVGKEVSRGSVSSCSDAVMGAGVGGGGGGTAGLSSKVAILAGTRCTLNCLSPTGNPFRPVMAPSPTEGSSYSSTAAPPVPPFMGTLIKLNNLMAPKGANNSRTCDSPMLSGRFATIKTSLTSTAAGTGGWAMGAAPAPKAIPPPTVPIPIPPIGAPPIT